jgi:selenocysteine lyase/cysteine desulfurase
VNEFSEFYSSVHRGNGFKSILSTEIYEQCRETVLDFMGADKNNNAAIFVRNSTEGINIVASIFNFQKGDIVICSRMEHHSNDLPWRRNSEVKYIDIDVNGELDLNHLESLLLEYGNRVKLIAVTGASNVTGYINPVHEIAKLAHKYGAQILIDASQLAPHRKINVMEDHSEEHLDFIVFTGHKLYAPFGAGVIIGPKVFFNSADPFMLGGGIVKLVTDDMVYWEEAPERNEAGTPNIIGALAIASAIKQIEEIGMKEIVAHENMILKYMLHGIKNIDGIILYGCKDADSSKRLGVVSFNVKDVPHALVASVLSYEYCIGVRNGCFCAHPYVLRLLQMHPEEIERHQINILNNDKRNLPGLVRASLGIYNTVEDIDRFLLALKNISEGKIANRYVRNQKQGTYVPENCTFNWTDTFKL